LKKRKTQDKAAAEKRVADAAARKVSPSIDSPPEEGHCHSACFFWTDSEIEKTKQ